MKAFFRKRPVVWRGGCILVACVFYALGFNLFLDPNQIAAGGLAGIATVLTRLIPVRVSILLVVMNIPLVVFAFFAKGWSFAKNSIGGFVLYTLMVELTSLLPPLTNDLLLATIFGGAFYGIGMALMTIGNGSIGGTELLNRILAGYFPSVGLDLFCPLVDGSIVVFSMVMFRDVQVGLCAILTILICSRLVNQLVKKTIWGYKHGDLCMIVTSKPAETVAGALMHQLGIAVTRMECTGMYSGTSQSVLMAAVTELDTIRVKEVLEEVDDKSFVVVLPAAEVMGGKLT